MFVPIVIPKDVTDRFNIWLSNKPTFATELFKPKATVMPLL